MSEKQRAEALLQAAGVVGVTVGESPEVVTMSKAEADALRAAAAAPAAGAPAPAGVPPQVQTLAAELVAGVPPGTAPGGLPEGILSEEAMNAELDRIERLPVSQQNKLDKTQVMASYDYHGKAGR
jgi:hypothetical protein